MNVKNAGCTLEELSVLSHQMDTEFQLRSRLGSHV